VAGLGKVAPGPGQKHGPGQLLFQVLFLFPNTCGAAGATPLVTAPMAPKTVLAVVLFGALAAVRNVDHPAISRQFLKCHFLPALKFAKYNFDPGQARASYPAAPRQNNHELGKPP
jgi:hypothetical protein